MDPKSRGGQIFKKTLLLKSFYFTLSYTYIALSLFPLGPSRADEVFKFENALFFSRSTYISVGERIINQGRLIEMEVLYRRLFRYELYSLSSRYGEYMARRAAAAVAYRSSLIGLAARLL